MTLEGVYCVVVAVVVVGGGAESGEEEIVGWVVKKSELLLRGVPLARRLNVLMGFVLVVELLLLLLSCKSAKGARKSMDAII